MANVQGGQGDKQTRLLVCSRALRQQHSDLPILVRARGPKRPMRNIMEHARGWCK
jgi:hypothetical protein